MTETLGPTDAEIRKWAENAESDDVDLLQRTVRVLAEHALSESASTHSRSDLVEGHVHLMDAIGGGTEPCEECQARDTLLGTLLAEADTDLQDVAQRVASLIASAPSTPSDELRPEIERRMTRRIGDG